MILSILAFLFDKIFQKLPWGILFLDYPLLKSSTLFDVFEISVNWVTLQFIIVRRSLASTFYHLFSQSM